MKTCILDVDGTLLSWVGGFATYMAELGHNVSPSDSYDLLTHYPSVECSDTMRDHIIAFNRSNSVGQLSPLPYMQAYVAEEIVPYYDNIIALSCFSNDWRSHILREINLEQHYGKIFSQMLFKPLGATKMPELMNIKPDLFIDDSTKYVEEGLQAGVRTIVLDSPYNQRVECERLNLYQWAQAQED